METLAYVLTGIGTGSNGGSPRATDGEAEGSGLGDSELGCDVAPGEGTGVDGSASGEPAGELHAERRTPSSSVPSIRRIASALDLLHGRHDEAPSTDDLDGLEGPAVGIVVQRTTGAGRRVIELPGHLDEWPLLG